MPNCGVLCVAEGAWVTLLPVPTGGRAAAAAVKCRKLAEVYRRGLSWQGKEKKNMEEAESKWNQLGHGGDGGPQGCVFETLAVVPALFMLPAFLSDFLMHKDFSSLTQAETIISPQASLFTGTEGEEKDRENP